MAKTSYPLASVYGLLEPGPVVLLTTLRNEQPNVMPLSWHTMLEFEPPLIGCVVSNRNYSYQNLIDGRECVINIPAIDIADKVVGCGNCSGASENKFQRFSLTPQLSEVVSPPGIAECFANLERGGSANPDIELSEISASMGDGNRLPRSRSNEKTPP